jgi:hypothetical protein
MLGVLWRPNPQHDQAGFRPDDLDVHAVLHVREDRRLGVIPDIDPRIVAPLAAEMCMAATPTLGVDAREVGLP